MSTLISTRDVGLPPPRAHVSSPSAEAATRAGILVTFACCTLFVCARFYSRIFILHNWGWDDSTMVVAWLANVATATVWCLEISVGQVSPQGILYQYGGTLSYELGVYFSQASILFFYLRLLPRGKTRTATIATLVLIVFTCLPIFMMTAFGCNPITGLFPFDHNITCVPALPLLYTGTAWAGVLDVWIMVIIFPVLIKLELPLRQKLALICLMSGGFIVIIASVIRVVIVFQGLHRPPGDWDVGPFIVWSCVQLSIGILCAAAPGTVPLLKQIFPRAMASLTGAASSNPYGARSAASRVRDMNGAVELNYARDQSVIKSNVRASRSRSQPKKSWYASQVGEHESQEDVLATGGPHGIMKTSEVVVSESRTDRGESDEDWTTDTDRPKTGL